MSYNYSTELAWISEDGSFSAGNELITFDPSLLTDEEWEIVDELSDSEKIIFALAVLNGEDDLVQEYLDEHRGE
jgi:hypothetical protein